MDSSARVTFAQAQLPSAPSLLSHPPRLPALPHSEKNKKQLGNAVCMSIFIITKLSYEIESSQHVQPKITISWFLEKHPFLQCVCHHPGNR